jgi:protease-4
MSLAIERRKAARDSREVYMRRIALLLCLVLSIAFTRTAFADTSTKTSTATSTSKSTIAVFRLSGEVRETPEDAGFAELFGPPPLSLKDIVQRLSKAADDKNVKAVVIFSEDAAVGPGQVEELRQAMQKLQAAGKDVYAHVDQLTTQSYVLLCGASRLSCVPGGDVWLIGLHAEQPYVRGLLDKIGVVPQFLHCGAYKSASEMFMRTGPSKEADEMMNWLFDGIYQTEVKLIAQGRKVDETKAKSWIDNGPYSAERAKDAGLIDAIEQRQDFEQMLKDKYGSEIVFEKKYGEPEQKKIDFSNPFAFMQIFGDLMGGAKKKVSNKPAVGIVYVDGPIMLGSESSSIFGGGQALSTEIRKALDEAAADDKVKAVVLRVDSPGGSAVASEVILDATKRVKAKKPLVVSMGNVAGSGGYYVTCASDMVFADANTITASIGVVGGKLVTNDMWNRIGITFKTYQRGQNSGLLATDKIWTESEEQRMQQWMNDVYGTFKKHVTDIRGSKLKKPIDELAGGRVFTGQQALELGLVDKIGTLNDAIAYAADQAKLPKDCDVRVVPEPKNVIERLIEQSSGDDDQPGHVSLGVARNMLGRSSGDHLFDLAMPLLKGLDPQRVAEIRDALGKLELMQREGVILTMPQVPTVR